ncbi:hypothetical protein ACJ73_08711 [Blastomyces percursus]|uniref:AAA+ ATPase domain-containing protein n=1 Tax=Blastomyces percursus TaxID=1658174 RepID=A0A1J9PQS1_9EURO|nr:hypothetical protein ACJ73_08711 [Blastomyces percursus]
MARASVLDHKILDKIWDGKKLDYMIVENPDAQYGQSDKYDEYLFVFRRRHERNSKDIKTYLDFKSGELINILRHVLSNVNAVNLRSERPSVSPSHLFQFLPDLEGYRQTIEPESIAAQHLDHLTEFLNGHFSDLKENMTALLNHGEITFELLGALFKPNELIFAIDSNSEEPRCFVYDSYEVKKSHCGPVFEISCRSLDYDGKAFGEVTSILQVPKFRGVKKVFDLPVLPLHYHQKKHDIERELLRRGRKFMDLVDISHREYSGLAHIKTDKGPLKFHVTGRIMIDALAFKEKNPNYGLPKVSGGDVDDFEWFDSEFDKEKSRKTVKHRDMDQENMADRDYMLCGPTVLGFSLSKRMWAEFAVAKITPIDWTLSPSFEALEIPKKTKKMIQMMVESHKPGSGGTSIRRFDDVVDGKGSGRIFLLHGPPGVGKTLTAEITADFLKRPRYMACAGDFGTDARGLEEHLTRILDLARRWNAILVLDEADVFLSERNADSLIHNSLVSVFLRLLEYFEGTTFLTTNWLTTLDSAVRSRIDLGISYGELSGDAKARVWKTHLKRASANTSTEELEKLVNRCSNGRQIKNIVRVACALAGDKTVTYEHVEEALVCNNRFDRDFTGAGAADNMNSYA